MKNFKRLMILVATMTLLVACQQGNSGSEENQSNEDKPKEDVQKEKEGQEEEKQEEQEEIVDERETKSLKEIKADALHEWTLTKDTTAVLVQNEGELETIDAPSVLGQAGDRQYTGDLSFYLVHKGEDLGYLQDELTDVTVNLDMAFTKPYSFQDGTIITWSQPEASNSLRTLLWRYTDGELKRVLFDGEEERIWSNKHMKFLKDEYLQAYYYNNHGGEKGIGWYYETWKWDQDQEQFTLYDEVSYTDAQEYGWESGENITKNWHENEEEYVLFPEITFTEELKQHIQEGKLAADGISLGEPIDKVLSDMPDYTAHEYYEGAMFYAFPGPYSYFYDEVTKDVSIIVMAGASITNDLASLKEILGEAEDEGYDEVESNYYTSFSIGDKNLRVEHDEDGSVSGLWFRELME